ncbi:hypothetical protein [Candidatus Arsenophonus triatominarum]|uniref:hypothetical protein n=1 Tax=Candidatus Arsenophonus triatominarum TaxID=57911 RepID=UPI0007C5768C|nr:hypothetical protein [Candidatus Arsenophonus triatominarum]
MKYFKATIITNVDHEKGKTTNFIYLASETKIAARNWPLNISLRLTAQIAVFTNRQIGRN